MDEPEDQAPSLDEAAESLFSDDDRSAFLEEQEASSTPEAQEQTSGGDQEQEPGQEPAEKEQETTPEEPAEGNVAPQGGETIDPRLESLIQQKTDERIKGFQAEFTRKSQQLAEERKAFEQERQVQQPAAPTVSPKEQVLENLLKRVGNDPEGQKALAKYIDQAEYDLKLLELQQQVQRPVVPQGTQPAQPADPLTGPNRDERVERLLLDHELNGLMNQGMPLTPEEKDTVLTEALRLCKEWGTDKVPLKMAYDSHVANKVMPKLRAQAESLKAKNKAERRAAKTAPATSSGGSLPTKKKSIYEMNDKEFKQDIKKEFLR